MTQTTTTARRIARTLNAKRGQGGFCVFAADGTDGYWYSEGSFPGIAPEQHRIMVPDRRMTAAEVQHRLDDSGAILSGDADIG